MKWRPMTDRETSAVMILTHIVQQCMARRSTTVPMRIATTDTIAGKLPPADQRFFTNAIEAGIQHKLLGLQGNDVFLSQFGKLFLAFAELISGDHKKFEEETHEHQLLEFLVESVANEPRFDPPKFS